MALQIGGPGRERIPSAMGSGWLWLGLVAAMAAIPLARALRAPPPTPPLVYAQLPGFQLVDQHGRAFTPDSLEGQVWVANFIFTRCPTICPAFTATMGQIQHRVRNGGLSFRLVSFTVDPEHDTPERLSDYARAHRASARLWSFVTGPREDLERLIIGGMKVHLQRGEEGDLMSVGHGSHFVLVDRKLRVRGYYRFDEAGSVDALMRDAALVAAEVE
ncbi:MAG: SCO family protein [Myxococcales bacterium]|nr:SCO family protein [Myxococcales bacterium]